MSNVVDFSQAITKKPRIEINGGDIGVPLPVVLMAAAWLAGQSRKGAAKQLLELVLRRDISEFIWVDEATYERWIAPADLAGTFFESFDFGPDEEEM